MTYSVENQLTSKFPFHPIEELNNIKSKIDLKFLTEKSEVRSKITATALQEFKLAESTYNEFMSLLHLYGYGINQNSEVVSSLRLNKPAYPETQSYLAPVLSEFYSGNYYIRNELQEIYTCLHTAYCELSRQSHCYSKGEKGEAYVRSEMVPLSTKYKTLYNIRIPSNVSYSNSAELDCVIATKKGLVICEVKTLGSELDQFVVSQDGLWTKIRDGHEEILSNSPSRQNMIHCLAVEKFFELQGLPQIKVIPVILFASRAKIKNRSCTTTILRPEMLYDFIEQSSLPEKYDDEFQERIITLLTENDLGENTFKIKTFNHENNILEITQELLQFVADNHNTAKSALTYKPEYPLSKTIGDILCKVLPILVGIALIVIFIKPILMLVGAVLFVFMLIIAFDFFCGA